MKRSKYLPFKLTNLLSIALKTIIFFIGLNIILTTISVLIKETIQDNFQKETSYSLVKDIR
tara:strand:- start:13 stop:195 length:183 start_codon:yes stop_codon:yes gene_type:complete